MKQLDLFEQCSPKDVVPKKNGNKFLLYVDGAARNNPGPAGVGIYIVKNDDPLQKTGFFIGSKTNNQAEYLALVFGVALCKEHMSSDDALYIMSDSQLLINQIKGAYKVKMPHLKPLYGLVMDLLQPLQYSVCHIRREYNTMADALANSGIDKKVKVPEALISLLHTHGISL